MILVKNQENEIQVSKGKSDNACSPEVFVGIGFHCMNEFKNFRVVPCLLEALTGYKDFMS